MPDHTSMQRRSLLIHLALPVLLFQTQLPEHLRQYGRRRFSQRLLRNVARLRQQLRHRFRICLHASSVPSLSTSVHSYFPTHLLIDGAQYAGARSNRHA